jgi:hypothetical protein
MRANRVMLLVCLLVALFSVVSAKSSDTIESSLQDGAGRNLAASANVIYPPQIYANPAIITGLLVGAFLIFFVFVGINCVLSVGSPDILMSTTLPAGKEY